MALPVRISPRSLLARRLARGRCSRERCTLRSARSVEGKLVFARNGLSPSREHRGSWRRALGRKEVVFENGVDRSNAIFPADLFSFLVGAAIVGDEIGRAH